jgi:hypothetical protein
MMIDGIMTGWMKYVCNEHYRVPVSMMDWALGVRENMLVDYYNAWMDADFSVASETSWPGRHGRCKHSYRVMGSPRGYLLVDGIVDPSRTFENELHQHRWLYGFDASGKLVLLVDNRYEILNTMPEDGSKPELYFV